MPNGIRRVKGDLGEVLTVVGLFAERLEQARSNLVQSDRPSGKIPTDPQLRASAEWFWLPDSAQFLNSDPLI